MVVPLKNMGITTSNHLCYYQNSHHVAVFLFASQRQNDAIRFSTLTHSNVSHTYS